MGKGLLGVLIEEGQALLVPDIAADARSTGFPEHHPKMRSFLGTPLRLGDRVYGNFYLTEKQGAAAFTQEDARHLERFSAQAALAVEFAEHAEHESRRLFRALLERAPFGVIFYPAVSGEPFGNPAAEEMLGCVCAEAEPHRPYELLRPDGTLLPSSESPGLRALRGESFINAELFIARANKPRLPTLASAAPVLSEDGAIVGAIAVYQDISTFKELGRLRVEFSAVIAHDMRTPMQSVMLQLEALLRRAQGEVASVPVATLRNMKRSGEHLGRLIGDLLDASRLETDQLPLAREVFRAEGGVRRLVDRLSGTLGPRRVSVVAHATPSVWADPVRFDQVLTNLIENAAKYSQEGAPIDIEILAERGGALVAVRDRGPGIPEDELPRLFDRFFRGRSAKGRVRTGLGLGLFISRRLAEAHGGTLTVTSKAGVGSTFWLWLPGPPHEVEEHPLPLH